MWSFSVCLLGWVITVNGAYINGLAVVEALWKRTGITGIIKDLYKTWEPAMRKFPA